jgi:2Fe-2S ferredoxin
MLEVTEAERRETSRLSCQLTVEDALDGLTVHVPEAQA